MKQILEKYLAEISGITKRGDAREESYYPALKTMLEAAAVRQKRKGVDVTVLPKKTEAGNPDFRVWDGKHKIVGYVEAKVPGENLDKIEKSEQLQRYLHTFPNLLLTDFHEFRFYRDGTMVRSVLIARPFIAKKIGATPPLEKAGDFEQLLSHFFDFSIPSIRTSKALALELAKRTRFLRDQVIAEELKVEEERNVLLGFYEAFKKYLIAGLTQEDFADLYAQTITYGLFTARHRFETTPNLLDKGVTEKVFTRENAFKMIPQTLGILRDVFHFISSSEPPKQLQVIIEDIAEVLAEADLKKITEEFFHAKRGRDPIVHFYETFLADYDPEKREKRGVYYTPEPVVSYIVRSLNHILKEQFGKRDGFASEGVTVLDPAAGTMTFPATALSLAAEEGKKYGEIEPMVRDHLLKDFYAFELMMAPYVIGHLKIAYVLEEIGYTMKDDDRFKLYLTNTLEKEDLAQTQIPHLSSLSDESHEAAKVKQDVPIMVIMGNPPYSGHSDNNSDWIRDLLHQGDGKVQSYFEVDGKPLGERNPKWLNDDYVKFLLFAQWKIEQAGSGVVGMITNHSYLDNPTFRGMRQSLMHTFTDIYVLDLHGNAVKQEMAPDGGGDENVFDIQQGVAICLMLKDPQGKVPGHVHHAELWGEREKKYKWLEMNDSEKTEWISLKPTSPFYFFVPFGAKSEKVREEYDHFWNIVDAIPTKVLGFQTHRDHFAIDFERRQMELRIARMKDTSTQDEELRLLYNLEDTRDWKLPEARKELQNDASWKDKIIPCLYRPFDIRWCLFDEVAMDYPRRELLDHVANRENLCLGIGRQGGAVNDTTWSLIIVARDPSDANVFRRGGTTVFPLYLYPSKDSQSTTLFDKPTNDKQPNFSQEFLDSLKGKLGSVPKPEQIFAYIYAILYSPEYRKRYSEFLKSDFPRIPLTSDKKLFDALAKLGQELIDLHLLNSKKLEKLIAKFEGKGEARVEQRKYDEKKQSVSINKEQKFTGIPPEVWNYHIGGYQVLDKWLKDRKGRALSNDDIRHYCRVATALMETMEMQEEIDEVIGKNGGFPIQR